MLLGLSLNAIQAEAVGQEKARPAAIEKMDIAACKIEGCRSPELCLLMMDWVESFLKIFVESK